MVNAELLKLLCCPETHQSLALASSAMLETVNRKITSGELLNRSGKPVSASLTQGLLRADGKVLYPVYNDIPVMLVDEAIVLA